MGLRGAALLAGVAVALGAAGSASAAPRALLYGSSLSQPTALAGDTLVGAVEAEGQRTRYSVVALAASGAPTTLFSADVTPTGDADNTNATLYSYAGSDTHLALAHTEALTTSQDLFARTKIRFGPRGADPMASPVVYECDVVQPPAFAIDGSRFVLISQNCGPGLLVHEAGTSRTVPVAAGASDQRLAVAGNFAAYEVRTPRGDGFYDVRIVVARLDTGEQVFGVDRLASGFALAPDGTLVFGVDQRVPDRDRSCLSGQLFVATPADPAPREVPGAQPCGRVELAGDRAVFRDPDAVLRSTSLTGDSVVLAREAFGEPAFDGAPGRVAVLMPSCSGSVLYLLASDGSSGEPEAIGTCTARLLSRTLRVRGRNASARFSCPRGCSASLSLGFAGGVRPISGGELFAEPGEQVTVPLRLSRSVARSVRRRGRRAARLQVYLRLPGGRPLDRTLSVVLRPAL